MSLGRRSVLVVLIALFSQSASAASKEVSSSPLLVMVEADPWLMVIGSDSPTFALYDDGEVIVRREHEYRSTKLNSVEFRDLVASLDLTALASLARQYVLVEATDQPIEHVFSYNDGKISVASVYGAPRSRSARAKLPPKLLSVLDKIYSFDPPRAKPWQPEKVEVMIWPYQYAPEKSIIWPKDWPGIGDKSTVRRGDGYSIFISSSRYAELKSFLAGRSEKGAVEIGGKKWAVSLRLPFPGEKSWMAASRK